MALSFGSKLAMGAFAALLAGFVVAAPLHGGLAADGVLRVGVQNERPPFSFTDVAGELRGFDVDLAWELCARLGFHCELEPMAFEALIPRLQEGRIDAAAASISITAERKQLVDFTAKYYQATNRFVARRGTASDLTLDQFSGRIIGVKSGTTHDRYLTNTVNDPASIRRYGNSDEIYIDLALGRLDLAFADTISLTEGFLQTELGQDFELVGPTLSNPEWFGAGEGIAVRKGNRVLLERLNRALRQILADGTYAEIRSQYFDYDVYGEHRMTAAERALAPSPEEDP
jgi:lysine-arginine-ornithine-binding protein